VPVKNNESVGDLLALFKRYSEEIADSWAKLVGQMPNSRYHTLGGDELRASTRNGMAAIIETLEGSLTSKGDAAPALDAYLKNVSVQRSDQGFDIREVIQAVMLVREAALPFLFTAFEAGSSQAYQAHVDLETSLRYMIGRLGHLYAEVFHQSLQAQQQQARELAHENARLYQETRQRLDESQSLRRVTEALLKQQSLAEVLSVVCSEALSLIGAQGSAVFLLEDDGWLKAVYSVGSGYPAYERMPVDNSFAGLAVQARKTMYTNDPSNEPIWYGRTVQPEYGQQISSLMAAPLSAKGKVIGALVVASKQEKFNDDDTRMMSLFADQAAIAIENARLYQQVERIAVMEERNRLARDLHDSVTQSLYGVTLYAEAAARRLSAGDADGASQHLRELQLTAQDALKEMRLLIFELRPPVLEKEGLMAALQARLDAVEGRAGLQTELHVVPPSEASADWQPGESRLPAAVEEGFYRIAQEALNNVLKHARAQLVRISLCPQPPLAWMEIRDDGAGFDLQTVDESGGFGLCGMKERAAQLGGRLVVHSQPEGGTSVRVEVEI